MNFSIPTFIAQSPLMRNGGFGIYRGLLDDDALAHLLDEAARHAARATESVVAASDRETYRGGNPARRLLTAGGGPRQTEFYQSSSVIRFLQRAAGLPVVPTGNAGTFSYYARPGDFLGLHRDILTCDLAVITCLYNSAPPEKSGGGICLFPDRMLEPLSTIRSNPAKGGRKLQLAVGETLLLLGGIIPHAILPVVPRQIRIVSILCYRILDPSSRREEA